jgi:hypothetical protein
MTRHGHLATGELLVKRAGRFGETTLQIRRLAGGFCDLAAPEKSRARAPVRPPFPRRLTPFHDESKNHYHAKKGSA